MKYMGSKNSRNTTKTYKPIEKLFVHNKELS